MEQAAGAARGAAVAAAALRVRAWEAAPDEAAEADDDATEVCGGGRGVDHPSLLHALNALADAEGAATLRSAENRTRARALELGQALALAAPRGAASRQQLLLAEQFEALARVRVARCEYVMLLALATYWWPSAFS